MLPFEIKGIINDFILPKKVSDTVSVFSLNPKLPSDIIEMYFMYSKFLNQTEIKTIELNYFTNNLHFLFEKYIYSEKNQHYRFFEDNDEFLLNESYLFFLKGIFYKNFLNKDYIVNHPFKNFNKYFNKDFIDKLNKIQKIDFPKVFPYLENK